MPLDMVQSSQRILQQAAIPVYCEWADLYITYNIIMIIIINYYRKDFGGPSADLNLYIHTYMHEK